MSCPGYLPTINNQSVSETSTISLLMIVFNFPPAATAGVHRPLRFTKYLGDFGCHASVLTRNCASEQGGDDLLATVPADVIVHRIGQSRQAPSIKQRHPLKNNTSDEAREETWLRSTLKSLLLPPWELLTETPDQHIGWAREASRHAVSLCKTSHFDAIYTTGPPHSTHLVGLKLHRKLGVPWVADFRDPWARHNWAKTRNPWGRRLLPYFERKVIRHATRVILNNRTSRDEFRRSYPEFGAEKFVAISNGFDPELIQTVAQLRRRSLDVLAANPQLDRTPVLCHPGSLYRQREPRPILKAIQQLRSEGIEVKFQQVGHAAEENNPLRIGAELGVEDLVEMLPKVSHCEALQRMSEADILLAIQPQAPMQVPGKLYEMLLFDLPILGVCDSEATSKVLGSIENAWSVPSQDPTAIAEAIKKALALPVDACANNRDRLKELYDGRNLTRVLRDVVEEAINQS